MVTAIVNFAITDILIFKFASLPISPDSIKPNIAPITAANTFGRNTKSFNKMMSQKGVLFGIRLPQILDNKKPQLRGYAHTPKAIQFILIEPLAPNAAPLNVDIFKLMDVFEILVHLT